MKILLTGSNGMVGKNILEHSNSRNYKFLVPSKKELDLLDYSAVFNYIHTTKPDFVIHAAGIVGGIQANLASPLKFLSENLDMGRNIILATKNNKIKNLMNLASSCMYPRDAVNPLSEDLILKGELEPTNEGYALAKILCTKLCEYIHREDNNYLFKTIIPCNLYGPYDKFDPEHSHMLPAVIRKLHLAKTSRRVKIDIWGDGEARREFMYAADLADFIFYAIGNYKKMPQNINVGLGVDYSINDYYQYIAQVVGYDGKFVHDYSKPVGMKQKLIDDTLLKKFGWRPKTSLLDGITKTYNFYITNYTN